MRRQLLFILFLLLSLTSLHPALAAKDPNDSQGSTDPSVFSRMPSFHIYRAEIKDFDRYGFMVGPDKKENVEGRHFFVVYYANEGIALPSALQVTRNYGNAAKAIGGDQVFEYEDGGRVFSTIKIIHGNKEIWAEVEGVGNEQYSIHVIEKELMKQDVVAKANVLASSINETGRVAVYGIYFDTDKAELKPESDAALLEIVKMLGSEAKLKLFVVGHTDNVGQFAHNVKLSQDRASAVVNALITKHKIAAARLTPFGDGPTAPVASNQNDEGRAKNRRVELVAQ